MEYASEEEIKSRFDLTVIQKLAQSVNPIVERNKILHFIKEEDYNHVDLKSIDSNIVNNDENTQALKNVVDFYLEPHLIQSMNLMQAEEYFSAIEDRMLLDVEDEAEQAKPVLVELPHHHCCFSIAYLLFQYFHYEKGFEKFVLLHQNQQLDPRLQAIKNAGELLHKCQMISQTFDDGWLKSLKRKITDTTVVFYFSDMSPKLFAEVADPATERQVELYTTESSQSVLAFSIAEKIAFFCRSQHFATDFPEPTRIRLKRFNSENPIKMPLTSWVFWPALDSLYQKD